MLIEGLDRSSNRLSVSNWNKSDVGGAQLGKVGRMAGRGVLPGHFFENIVWVEWGWGVQGFTGFGIGAFPAQVNAPPVANGLSRLGRNFLGVAGGPVRGKVLPQGGALPFQPSSQPLPREGNPLVLVLFAGAGGST